MTAATLARIDAALAANDIPAAAALAEAALAGGANHPMLLNLAAWAREEAGDHDGAQALLERALTLSPGDPLILSALGRVQRLQGRLGEAMRNIDAALGRESGNPSVWLERGLTLDAGNSLPAALESYRRAAALDPNMAPAWAGVASVASRTGDAAAARAAGLRALAIDPGDAMAASAVARLDIEAGDAPAAVARLQELKARGFDTLNRLLVEGVLGDALAKTGDAEGAFTAYATAKAAFVDLHGHRFDPGAPTHHDHVEAITRDLAAAAPHGWPRPEAARDPGEAGTHIFLCGYPRSGNTLAENILASLAGAQAVEERPTLAEAETAFLFADGGIARLAALTAAEAEPFRTAYWAKVAACGVPAAPAIFVDMDPLKSVALPLIARLFPMAKVVLMRRDPRDVVWSVFHTLFAPNSSTMEFVTLDRAARHYDAVMRLTETCLATLPLDVLVVRYEELVGDFDAATRGLCDFLGVPWSESLRAFDRTAQRRGVTTASAAQVRRGLYNGSGQWRPFAAQMAGVLPLLEPWVERFGYAT